MQSNSPFSTPPPIPTPDGNIPPSQNSTPFGSRSDWQNAPSVVRGWAYPLTWLGIVVLPIVGIATLALVGRTGGAGVLMLLFLAALFAANVWLNRNLKKGVAAAWVVQTVLSGFIVLSSALTLLSRGGNPVGGLIGAAIHAYILSQWFKPETKAWFGRS